MSRTFRALAFWGCLLSAAAIFVFSGAKLWRHPKSYPDQGMAVVLPPFMQVLMMGGDKYLAANIAVVRSLHNSTVKDSYDNYLAQARIQSDAARFNPRHEDNYYLAAAMLSGSGHARAAEGILEKAANGRPFDMLPPFFLGFDYYHYEQNPALGAKWLYEAASRADGQNRYSLSRIAARWAERGQDAQEALNMVRIMKEQAHGRALKQYLAQREQRLQGLVILQVAARDYKTRTGLSIVRLNQLQEAGILEQLPVDPVGLGYGLDAQGQPQLNQPPQRAPVFSATQK